MPNFNIVSDASKISFSKEWKTSNKFNCKNRIVDERGREVTRDYKGHRYQIIEKREILFSTLERIQRVLLGIFVIISTLSLGCLSSSVRKLFTKSKKKIRFAISYPPPPPSPNQQRGDAPPPVLEQKIDRVKMNPSPVLHQGFLQKPEKEEDETFKKELEFSKKELEKGISLSDEEIEKVGQCIKKIFKDEKDPSVKFYKSRHYRWVFELPSIRGLIFKMKPIAGRRAFDEHEKMIRAETIIRLHQLRLLVVPHAKLLKIEWREVLVEEKLNFDPRIQQRHLQDDRFHETLLQLAKFFCKSNCSQVEWDNHRILNDRFDQSGNRKIGLINFEKRVNPELELFGNGFGDKGLVGCANEEQAKMIEAIAKENGVSTASFEGVFARRKKELAEDCRLKQFYEKRGIFRGDEPIRVDEKALDFSMYPAEKENLKRLALELIQVIDEKTSKSSSEESIKNRRYIRIETDRQPFLDMGKELVDPGKRNFKTSQEYFDNTFFGCVAKKLVNLEVFYFADRLGPSWDIQA